jgi:hypothetical protein
MLPLQHEPVAREIIKQAQQFAEQICFSCGVALSDHPARACQGVGEENLAWIPARDLRFDALEITCLLALEDEREVILGDLGAALAQSWIAGLQVELAAVLGELLRAGSAIEEVLLLGCQSTEPDEPAWGNCRLLAAIRPPAGFGIGYPELKVLVVPGFNYHWRVDVGVAEELARKFAHSVDGAVQLHLANRYRSKIRDHAVMLGADDPDTRYAGGKMPEMRYNDYAVD